MVSLFLYGPIAVIKNEIMVVYNKSCYMFVNKYIVTNKQKNLLKLCLHFFSLKKKKKNFLTNFSSIILNVNTLKV